MQGPDTYQLDPATSIQKQKFAVYRTLPVKKSGTIFADCFKCHPSNSFPWDMIGLFDSPFESMSFLVIRHLNNVKKSDFKIIGYSPILCTHDMQA